MKTKTRSLIVVFLAVLITSWAAYHFTKPEPPKPVALETRAKSSTSSSTNNPDKLTKDLSKEHLTGYASPSSTPEKDLLLIRDLIEDFHAYIKEPGALPTWGNKEIMSAFIGKNAYRIRFISPDSPHLNHQQELTDRWSTPIFFHFEDARYPELRSAGEDQKLWTGDDITLNTAR